MQKSKDGGKRFSEQLFLLAAALIPLLLFVTPSRGDTTFVKIVSTTNTTIVSVLQSGNVSWTNAAVPCDYSVLISTSLSADGWTTIESGTSTSIQQTCWVDLTGTDGLVSISGTVRHLTGVVAHCPVELLAWSESAGFYMVRRITTGADGTFKFGQLPASAYQIDISAFENYEMSGYSVDSFTGSTNVDMHLVRNISDQISPSNFEVINQTMPLISWGTYPSVTAWAYNLYDNGNPVLSGTTNSTSLQITDPLTGFNYGFMVRGSDSSGMEVARGYVDFFTHGPP